MSLAPPTKRNSSFKGDVLRLVSGTGLAQLITLLAAPILTRLYSPEAFGVAALFASITGILGVIACLSYELAIVLPDNERDAANLLGVSVLSALIISALTALIIWYGGQQILDWVNMPELVHYLWIIPIVVLIHGIYIALNYWNTRTKNFMRLAVARVISQLAGTGTSLSLGISGHTTGGSLIFASLSGQTVAILILFTRIWRENGRYILSALTWRGMWDGIVRHRNFPLFSSWSALINTASWQIPVLLFAVFFSPAVVGFYSLGFRLIQMPLSLIGSAISQAFFQRGAEAEKNGELARLVDSLYNRMLVIGMLPSMILVAIGADLFSFVFGVEWYEAGVYTQILAPWALVWFLSSPLSSIYYFQEKQKKDLALQIAIFIIRFFAILIGGLMDNPRIAVALFSAGGIIAYGYMLHAIFIFSGLKTSLQAKKMMQNIAVACMYTAPIFILNHLTEFSFYWVLSLSLIILFGHYFKKRDYLVQFKY